HPFLDAGAEILRRRRRRRRWRLGVRHVLRKLGLSVDAPARVVHPLIAIALVMAAVCGYLLGSHRVSAGGSQSAALGPSRVATSAGLLLEYPTGWEQASTSESIPGLSLKEAVTLRPRGS